MQHGSHAPSFDLTLRPMLASSCVDWPAILLVSTRGQLPVGVTVAFSTMRITVRPGALVRVKYAFGHDKALPWFEFNRVLFAISFLEPRGLLRPKGE
jgi:hypothetical protein